MRGNPLFAVVIPAKAGIQELPAKAGTSLDPGSSPGGFPRTPSRKNSFMAGGSIKAGVGATGESSHRILASTARPTWLGK